MVRTRPYHHGDLSASLLKAVDAVVRERGVGALTLREVARRAGVSHSAPAHHFGDKAGLLTAYAAEGFASLTDQLLEARRAAESAGEDPLLAIGLGYVRFAVAEPGRFSVMFRPEHVHGDQPLYREACDSAFGVLFDTVAQLRRDLDRQDPELAFAATGAWSIVHGFATLWLDGNLPEELTSRSPREATGAMLSAFGATMFVAAARNSPP